jgi:hypothetical protein
VNLEKMVENHFKVKSSYESANGDLNWVHTAISNLKRIYWEFTMWSVKSPSRVT